MGFEFELHFSFDRWNSVRTRTGVRIPTRFRSTEGGPEGGPQPSVGETRKKVEFEFELASPPTQGSIGERRRGLGLGDQVRLDPIPSANRERPARGNWSQAGRPPRSAKFRA